MKKTRPLVLSTSVLALIALLFTPLVAQVNYKGGYPWEGRTSTGPDAEVPGWYYNLGLTGIRAELVPDDPKVLVVRYVFPKTPASELVKIGDRILGAGGKSFRKDHINGMAMEAFGAEGPVGEMAEELENCQGLSGSGELPLTVRRGDETLDVILNIGKKYGEYSTTYPAKCQKSEKIRKELLAYILKQQTEDGSFGNPIHNTFGVLAMLASGEKRFLPAIERNLRFVCKSLLSSEENKNSGLMNWTYMGAAIALSEYYLITKKAWVLPELEKFHQIIEKGQYLDMSQINPSTKISHPSDYPKGPKDSHGGWGHNPGFEGYGPISMITAQGALAYSLMQRCGIKIQRGRLDAAFNFLKRGTSKSGFVWYGDEHEGGPTDWRGSGPTGATAIANFLSPYKDGNYRECSIIHTKMIGEHPQSFPDTHASPTMGMAYTALGAAIDPPSFRKLMDANRWWFTMAQCTDQTFYCQPARDVGAFDSDSRMNSSVVVAFIFSIPMRNLVVTGREAAR
jgi:Family of unknown function (DUF6288)